MENILIPERPVFGLHEKADEGARMKGVYTFTKALIETREQWALHTKIQKWMDAGRDYMPLVRQLNQMCRTEKFVFENIIPTVGRTMIANNLTAASPTNTPRINYTALGIGTTAVANGDTQLTTEVYRKATASATNSANIGYVTAFYSATETNGTYKEAGLFCNASGTANSGVLFSHVLLNPTTGIAKSNTETLTIDYTLTIS